MRLFDSFQMRIPHVFLATATLLTLTAFEQGKARGCSQTSEYAIEAKKDGVVRCEQCPTCGIGEGLAVECGISVKEGTQLDCINCTERKTFSNTNDRSLCEPCSECVNREVLKNCSRTQDRECGSCLPGYEEDGKESPPGCTKKPTTKPLPLPTSSTTPTRVSAATLTITIKPSGEQKKAKEQKEDKYILGAGLVGAAFILLVYGLLFYHFCWRRQSNGKDACNTV